MTGYSELSVTPLSLRTPQLTHHEAAVRRHRHQLQCFCRMQRRAPRPEPFLKSPVRSECGGDPCHIATVLWECGRELRCHQCLRHTPDDGQDDKAKDGQQWASGTDGVLRGSHAASPDQATRDQGSISHEVLQVCVTCCKQYGAGSSPRGAPAAASCVVPILGSGRA